VTEIGDGCSSPLKVSVVLPVKDGVRFIKASLMSLLSQEGVEVDVVVVDDSSVDGTVEVVECIMEEDGRVRLVRLGEEGGIAAALNLVSGGRTYLMISKGIHFFLLSIHQSRKGS